MFVFSLLFQFYTVSVLYCFSSICFSSILFQFYTVSVYPAPAGPFCVESACSPRVCVGSLRVPTVQTHAGSLVSLNCLYVWMGTWNSQMKTFDCLTHRGEFHSQYRFLPWTNISAKGDTPAPPPGSTTRVSAVTETVNVWFGKLWSC